MWTKKNVAGASIHIKASSKWEKFQLWMSYPFKSHLCAVHPFFTSRPHLE